MANRRLLAFDPTYGVPTEVNADDNATVGMLTALGIGGIAFNANGNVIQNVGNPVAAGDAVNKQYADAISQGVTQLPSVRALAVGNIPLTGLQTVDGVSLVAGDRLLCIGQTNAVTNGVYIVQTGAYKRPAGSLGVSDWTTGRLASGLAMFVREGTAFADQGYVCITDNSPKIDTDPVAFTQYTGLGEVVAGNGLQKLAASGNQIAINLAPASGLQFTNAALDHLLRPTGALVKDASGLGVLVNGNNTLAADANGLRALGLPAQFTVAGTAVDANVTAGALNALVDGPASLADALHNHQNVLEAMATVATHRNGSAPLAVGDPVQWSATADTMARSDATSIAASQVMGIAMAPVGANGTGKIVKRGVARGVLSQATPGAPIYLAVGGGLTAVVATGVATSIVRVGWAVNATDLDVSIAYLGQRSAN